MPFISYAQNSEDVLLWRVFRDVGAGFYVDVGACHPDQDSVTRAFHDRGWTGINIEPVPALARRIAQARPRDVTLALAAGAFDGTVTLHVVADTGLSTTDADTATMLDRAGMIPEPLRVPVRRLAGILRDHAPDVVHFLKIDVEGAERAVIEGGDFVAHRPRVILVEAVQPLSATPNHADWEGLLLAAGYRFVLFDGLNRYYVADEWAAALGPHFAAPVNVGDDYIRVADASWARRAAEQDARVKQATERAAAAQEAACVAYSRAFENARDLGAARVAVTRAEYDRDAEREHQRITMIWAQASDAARAASEASRDASEASRAASEARVERLEAELDALRRSTSWRITRPARTLAALARRRPPAPQALPTPQAPEPLPEVEKVAEAGEPLPSPAPTAAKPGLLRAVHQFHSGSATGDAVTNSMLLIRRKLLALGYRSEIFVQHVDPALADDLRLLDDLPAHSDYVLIVHHSMGHDALDRLLATAAPKVLYYHNITPAQFLPPVQSLLRYGVAGREQLALLQPVVSAALAASEYNAIELRRAGFEAVAACSLLFDLDRMRQAPARMGASEQPVTILFVGRIIESKGQADLVDAFARFHERLGRPTRLVLVGRTDSPGEYLALVDDRIRAHGLEEAVIVTGPVPDAELRAQYAAADLYVSLSHHEGFGVPLVEAAVHGIPVLAWPCGAVPYTLPPPAGLLQTRDPDAVAERMLALVEDAELRDGLIQAQRQALDRFSFDRQWPAMQQALAMAGAALPPDPAAAAALAEHLQFTVTGHAEGSYSLAAINRALAASIEAERPGQVRLVPYENGPADMSRLPDATRPLAERGPRPTGPDVVISQHYPIHVPAARGDLTLALVFWEESLLPQSMIAALNQGFDGVLAPSRFVAKALLDSGLTRPVRVVGHAPDLTAFEAIARQRGPSPAGQPCTFLHVSSCFPRKGVDVLLQAYAAAFRKGDPVRLVIKGFPNPHNTVPEQVAALQALDPDAPCIEVINRDLEPEAMLDLYRDADVMVLPTRGEGLNLPAAEAMAAGLPLIVTGYGGHLDFCDAGTARLLRYRLQPSASHLATPGSLWAEPDRDDLASALREVARNKGDALRTSLARAQVALRLGRRAMVRRLSQASVELLLAPPRPALRVAWITSWATRCGVAEYSRHLIAALPDSPAIASHVVLSDDRAEPDAGGQPRSVPAWSIADHGNIRRMVRAVVSEDPHIVVVQHQPGLIAWPGLAALVKSPVMAGRTVVVTLHTTRQLMQADPDERLSVCAALGSVARVVVHTRDDLHQMQELGLSDNVTLVPHGVRAPLPPRPAMAVGSAPLVGCYGFFLPGKGIGELIQAMGLLRRKRPQARLRLVNAEYGNPISAAEIARCRLLAAEAGVDGIEWETRFLPEDESLEILAGCDAIVIPTQASNESSSAAVRTALVAGSPVLVTPLPLFDDVGDAVTRSLGVTPEDLEQALDALLSDPMHRHKVQNSAQAWLHAHSWPMVAARMQGMLLGLSMQSHT